MRLRSEETRTKILAVAQALFAQKGYDATGIMDICQAAGVSKGAVYHHFLSKQAIFMALLEGWLDQLDVPMLAALEAAPNIPQGLIEMAGLTGIVFKTAHTQFHLFLEFWVQASRQPEIWQTVIAPYHHYQAMLSTIFARGVQEGSLDVEINPDAAARMMMALVMGLVLQASFDPNDADWSEVTQDSIRLLVNGIGRRKE